MTHAELLAAGFEIDAAAYERLRRFVERLLRENRRLNLLSPRAAAEIWPAHVCDSLALLPLVRPSQPARLLDLGTGGGLPGVPLACADALLHVTLLDATRKKVEAVRRICSELGFENVATIWGRAETLAHDPTYRESFDLVTARALAPLPALLEYAAGFVRPGGRCHFFKSCQAAAKQREAARAAADACEMAYDQTITYSLPAGHGERAIVTYIKQGPLRDDLPRSPGRAGRKSL
ncbi:MAG TPA: 16S rRNA (guanine(527)-N(7))-methyltransferase RsmG [Phycisphaerae bacterium]|nr:16S rRNA (guanine(527)-N(7))-methyltransferase RsmG [Phycisphaerae bacterium]